MTYIRSKVVTACIAGLLAVGTAKADKPTKNYNMHESRGSTRAQSALWVVEKDDGSIFAQIQTGVRKTGVSGTGWACVHALFLDKDNNVVVHRSQTKTVGATLKGDTGVQDSPMQKFDISKEQAQRIVTVVTFTEIEDSHGGEMVLDDIKKKVNEAWKKMIDGGEKPEPGKGQKSKDRFIFERLK